MSIRRMMAMTARRKVEDGRRRDDRGRRQGGRARPQRPALAGYVRNPATYTDKLADSLRDEKPKI